MSSQDSSSIRISCPQCGGNIKVPPFQVGQRSRCPRCDAEIAAAGQTPPEPPEATDGLDIVSTLEPDGGTPTSHAGRPVPDVETPVPTAETPRPAPRPAPPPDDDVYGISCLICGTRLHVQPSQVGTTIQCPDCFSPVEVKPPSKHSQATRATLKKWEETESPIGPTAMQAVAQSRLEKARVEQEEEEAEERESSAERFTDGLFEFFPDPQAVIRLAVLAVCFELAATLLRFAAGMTIEEGESATVGEATSLAATLGMGFFLLTFLAGVAACGLALVKDTSEGLRKIEHWPGVNPLEWGRDVFYIVNACIVSALPGAALGFLLAWAGIHGMVTFGGVITFGALFPPMLLSMFHADSLTPLISNDVWAGIRRRSHPWKLTYLISTCAIIVGLFAFSFCLAYGFFIGIVSAAAMVASIMIYFRTVGRLFCILAGRDTKPQRARNRIRRDSSEGPHPPSRST